MKTKLALLALPFILTFGMIANVSAAVTASTGISLAAISMSDARYNIPPNELVVSTNPGQVFLSYHIADSDSQYFILNSVIVDILINGSIVSSESFAYYDLGNRWNRVGYYNPTSFAAGPMNQGNILVGWGNLNSADAYTTTVKPGDIWQGKMTYDIQGQGVFTSVGTMTYVPEPSTTGLIALSTFCFLRRKRK
jgi:hypothetical protein